MAPNKKKRKPASNPNRGFATTSVASKQRDDASPASDAAIVDVPESSKHTLPGADEGTKIVEQTASNDKEVLQMTPEELESHLENADLQNLVDTHSEKLKQQASRNITKLMTEKRLLRQQVDVLATWGALPPELLQHVFDKLDIRPPMPNLASLSSSSGSSLESVSHEDYLLPAWRLSLTLRGLGFKNDLVDEALRAVLKNRAKFSAQVMREPEWGLEASLAWLAARLAEDSKTDYSHPQIDISVPHNNDADELGWSYRSECNSVFLTFAVDSPPSEVPRSSQQPETNHTNDYQTEDDSERNDDVSDFASDMEPDQMAEKYVALKSTLYAAAPKLVDGGARRGRKNKGHSQVAAAQSSLASNRKVRRVQVMINKLESDVLFDQQIADVLWASRYIDLQQEEAERRRLGMGTDEPPHLRNGENNKAMSEIADDPELMLGDMFAALPDVEGAAAIGSDVNGDVTASVKMRRFGAWTGVHPRRVLEEACKARSVMQPAFLKILELTIMQGCVVQDRLSQPRRDALHLAPDVDNYLVQISDYSTLAIFRRDLRPP